MTDVEDLLKQVEVLREFGIGPVLINLGRVDKFCPVIVEMCGLRTDCHSGTKNYKLNCLKVEAGNMSFFIARKSGRDVKMTRCSTAKKEFFAKRL